jgi:tetratricopeptide (TPR) repeat protein
MILITALIICAPRAVGAQSLDDVRKAYDAGDYQRVAEMGGASQDPRVLFVVGQAQQKLRKADDARRAYEQLATRPDGEPWGAIGRSAIALLGSNADGAVQEADQAVARGDSVAEAHYQRGLALSARQDLGGAAAEFQKAADLDPSWSYPHYYAGIAYSKIKRADLTATHFQTFLKLAPEAPERAEVQSILRTLGK